MSRKFRIRVDQRRPKQELLAATPSPNGKVFDVCIHRDNPYPKIKQIVRYRLPVLNIKTCT